MPDAKRLDDKAGIKKLTVPIAIWVVWWQRTIDPHPLVFLREQEKLSCPLSAFTHTVGPQEYADVYPTALLTVPLGLCPVSAARTHRPGSLV